MDQPKTPVSSSRDGEETGMEQIMSDLQALKRLYGLLHKDSSGENLDETSRDLLLKMLDDATQQTLLKQAKMLSGSLMLPALERKLSIRSDRRSRDAEPSLTLKPPVSPSPSPSILPGERSSQAGGQAAEEPLLARLASYRSSRTAVSSLMSLHRRPRAEQRNSGPVAATSLHGTVIGSNRHADRWDRTPQSSARGDLSSLEDSSHRRSVSREVSLDRAWLQHSRGMGQHQGVESSSSTCRFGRLDSGLPFGMASRRGSERTGRDVAAMSRHGTVTGSNRHAGHWDRTRRTSRRGDQSSLESSSNSNSRRRSVSREIRVDFSGMYISRSSSGAAISYASTSPTASLESSASASYSPPPVSRRGFASAPPVSLRGIAPPVYAPRVSLRGIAPPVYASRVSRSMRRRRRQEIMERRVGRLRMLKNKIATVFHHRHDHHHHLGRGMEGPSSRLIPGEHQRKSPWSHLGEMFHRPKAKKIMSQTVVGGAPTKRRGNDGNMHELFNAMRRHLRGKRRTSISVKMRRAANRSRVQVKKMHWWQRLRKQHNRKDVTAGRPRRRLDL